MLYRGHYKAYRKCVSRGCKAKVGSRGFKGYRVSYKGCRDTVELGTAGDRVLCNWQASTLNVTPTRHIPTHETQSKGSSAKEAQPKVRAHPRHGIRGQGFDNAECIFIAEGKVKV